MTINCTYCKRNNDVKEDGKHQCRGCKQYLIVKNSKLVNVIPKELVY